MVSVVRVIRRGIGEFEYHGWLYVIANVFSVVLALPIITAPAAYAALSHLSYTVQTSKTATMSDYWQGFRIQFRRGVIMGIANVLILGIIASNFYQYRMVQGIAFVALRLVWTSVLIGWLAVQTYCWPFLDRMETPSLGGALRNAALMIVLNPGFTFGLMIFFVLVIVVSLVTLVPLLLLVGGLLTSIANVAVQDRLRKAMQVSP